MTDFAPHNSARQVATKITTKITDSISYNHDKTKYDEMINFLNSIHNGKYTISTNSRYYDTENGSAMFCVAICDYVFNKMPHDMIEERELRKDCMELIAQIPTNPEKF